MKGQGAPSLYPSSSATISGLENNFVSVSHIKITPAAVFCGAADHWNISRNHLLNGNHTRAVIRCHFLQIHGCHAAYESIKLCLPLFEGSYMKPSIKSVWFGAPLDV